MIQQLNNGNYSLRNILAFKKNVWNFGFLALFLIFSSINDAWAQNNTKIDRKALVQRHNLDITEVNLEGPTQVGNGHFAFGSDITGLQTFGNYNANTLSDWGWYKFPFPEGKTLDDFNGQQWDTQGRLVRYDMEDPDNMDVSKWMSVNPVRLHLGRLGFVLKNKNGKTIKIEDLDNPHQSLDLWTGIVRSEFTIDGKNVKVTTIGHPVKDAVAIRVEAENLNDGQIEFKLTFPYASDGYNSTAANWEEPDKHQTIAAIEENSASYHRKLDKTEYYAALNWKGGGTMNKVENHTYILQPTGKNSVTLVLDFHENKEAVNDMPSFKSTETASKKAWKNFWESGGAIDLSQSKDPRWKELERRIVLSQYLMRVNEAGSLPPQESGLVNNTWYGKFHMEMLWWHAAHYALWDRLPLMDSLTSFYRRNINSFTDRTKAQGYDGVRWPKTLGDDEKWEWPHQITPLLIWQQPHPLFFAELEYQIDPSQSVLDKWNDVVELSADFMASFPVYNEREDRYILGYPLQVVSEYANPRTTINPTFELSYWRTGLKIAQKWRKRLGLPEKEKYQKILNGISDLPVVDDKYVTWENIYSMWTVYQKGHPDVIGAYGMLPGDGVDTKIMENTLKEVDKVWDFESTWGWDFPMLAMTAARLGQQDRAIDYLLEYPSFKWDEHGFSGGGVSPYPYFPGNGGILYAVGMMVGGWEGSEGIAPGFPKDGSWVVKYEKINKAL